MIVAWQGTPFEGGTFVINIDIPTGYPFEPPKMKFITKIWHPNISSQTGAICLVSFFFFCEPFSYKFTIEHLHTFTNTVSLRESSPVGGALFVLSVFMLVWLVFEKFLE